MILSLKVYITGVMNLHNPSAVAFNNKTDDVGN